jgi:thiamine kinase-like enzyme
LEHRYFAIDWEYAARGSRHFDIAVASQNKERTARDDFAERTAGVSFDRPTWQAACRVERLMDHLWTLAVLGRAEIEQSKEIVARRWMPHE